MKANFIGSREVQLEGTSKKLSNWQSSSDPTKVSSDVVLLEGSTATLNTWQSPTDKSKIYPDFVDDVVVAKSTPAVKLQFTGTQTVAIRLPTKDKIEAYDVGAATSLGYLCRYKTGQRIPIGMLHKYPETSYTANTTIDLAHFPLDTGIPQNTKLRIFLKADMYNNGGYTTTLKAIFNDGTASLTTTSTTYVTLSTIVDVPTPNVSADFSLAIDVSGGTAYIKQVTAMLLLEFE